MDNPLKEVKRYLLVVYKKRFIFLSVALIVTLMIIVGSFFMTKKYEATSTVFIERNMIDSLMKGLTITPSMNDRIRVLRYYMLSRDMVTRTLKDLDMDLKAESSEAFDAMVQKYRNATNINIRGGDLFIVSLKDTNPVFARDFINTLVNKYVEENVSDKREEAYGADRFIGEQLGFFKNKLDEAQNEIIAFRREKGIYSSVDEASLIENIKNSEEELEWLKSQKNEMLATISTIRQQLEMMKGLSGNNPMDFSIEETSGDQGGRIAQLEARLEQLLYNYNEQYPEVVRIKAQIEELRRAQEEKAPEAEPSPTQHAAQTVDSFNPLEDPIYVDLKMRLNAKESELQALEARLREVQSTITANKDKLENYPHDMKVLADLERTKRTYQNLYEQLLQRQGVTEVSKQMEVADKTTTFRIVDPAIIPTQPVSIDRFKVMVMGIFAGFAAGLGLVILIEKLDGKFKDPEHLRALGVPILVEIPTINNPIETARIKRRNSFKYLAALSGYALVGCFLVHDLLNLGVIDRFISDTHLDRFVSQFINF